MKTVLLACIFMSALFPAVAQDNHYDLIVAGRNIGSMKVFNAEEKDDVEVHRIESKFKVFFYAGQYSILSNFSQGKLLSSVAYHKVNGDLKEKTQTKSTSNSFYDIMFTGSDAPKENKKQLHTPINNTVTSLYYREPVNVKEVYSERFGQMCSVKKISDGHYGVSLPDGKQGIYTYRDGECREVQTEMAGFKLRIVRNDTRSGQPR